MLKGLSHQAVADPSARFFEAGTALARVLEEAPYLSRCSDDKTATRIRPREYAIRYPYMQINRSGFVSWLIFDLDHARPWQWEDAGLPAPNLIVRNRSSGHAHLFYAITPVCTTAAARSKPIQFMKAVYRAFAERLDADADFHSGPVAKTPGHPWWATHELHPHVFELGELADYVDLDNLPRWAVPRRLAEVSHSRHCILFEHLRHFAYSVVGAARKTGSYESFYRGIEAHAHTLNRFVGQGFSENLPLSGLRATAKSVARWTWDRYAGAGGIHRGVMDLNEALPLRERQRLAAARTHQMRKQSTSDRIRAACAALHQAGRALSIAAVARAAAISRPTVAKYRDLLKAVSSAPVLSLDALRAAVRGVKNAVHQVTAGQSAQGKSHCPECEGCEPDSAEDSHGKSWSRVEVRDG